MREENVAWFTGHLNNPHIHSVNDRCTTHEPLHAIGRVTPGAQRFYPGVSTISLLRAWAEARWKRIAQLAQFSLAWVLRGTECSVSHRWREPARTVGGERVGLGAGHRP